MCINYSYEQASIDEKNYYLIIISGDWLLFCCCSLGSKDRMAQMVALYLRFRKCEVLSVLTRDFSGPLCFNGS